MSTVATHERFNIDADALARLRDMGVEVIADIPDETTMGLKHVQPGEEVLGEATADEMRLFATLLKTDKDGQQIYVDSVKSVAKQGLDRLSNATTMEDVIKGMGAPSLEGMDLSFSESLWETRQRYIMLHSMLWYGVSHRLAAHSKRLNIRRGGKVVTTGART